MKIFVYSILVVLLISCSDEVQLELENEYDVAMSLYKAEMYDEAISKLQPLFDHSIVDRNELKVKALYLRGFIYYLRDQNKLAYQDYIKALDIANEIGDDMRSSKLNNEIGLIFLDSELFEQASIHFKLALGKSDEASTQDIAHYYYNLGRSLRRLDKMESASEYFLKAIDINNGLRNFDALSNCYLELGLLQHEVGNEQLALNHFNEILRISDLSYKADIFRWKANNNIGNVYLSLGKVEEAESFFQKSLSYEKNDSQLSVTYNNLGKIANEKGDYERAWEYFKKSIQFNSKKIEMNELAITNMALRKTLQELDQPDSLVYYTMRINELALPSLETQVWLKNEEDKIVLLTKYQDYERKKAEREQYAKTSWLMAFIMTFILVSGLLSVRLWKIYNYKSAQKGLSLIKNSNEMVYLLDMFKKEKEEMRRVMNQKNRT